MPGRRGSGLIPTPPSPPRPGPHPAEEANDACFIVRDGTAQALGYFYFEEKPGRRSAAKLLTKDEAPTAARRTALKPQRRWKSPRNCR